MIPRQYRLLLSPRQSFVGRVHHGQWCVVVTQAHPQSQWAVRISTKIDPRATVRNRLRRQINQWLYQHQDSLKLQRALIILRRRPTDKTESNLLFEEITKHLWKLDQSEIGK